MDFKEAMIQGMTERDLYREQLRGKLKQSSINGLTAEPDVSRDNIMSLYPIYKALNDEQIMPINAQIRTMMARQTLLDSLRGHQQPQTTPLTNEEKLQNFNKQEYFEQLNAHPIQYDAKKRYENKELPEVFPKYKTKDVG